MLLKISREKFKPEILEFHASMQNMVSCDNQVGLSWYLNLNGELDTMFAWNARGLGFVKIFPVKH